MSKIEQNKEKKRHKILTAAKDTFLSEGYELASMDKIAALAQMTKQTVYRYFPSKIELFEATLRQIGTSFDDSFLQHLQNSDTREALEGFAITFIQFHLSKEHIATARLLIAESGKAPEIVSSFRSVGPDQTDIQLSAFFTERLNISKPESTIRLWTGMLLSIRTRVLMGMGAPDQQELEAHAKDATKFLFDAIL